MELVKDTPFETAWLLWMARPESPCLTAVVKGTFTIVESGDCPIDPEQVLPSGDIHHDDDTSRSVRYETDLAYIKKQAEAYIAGSCFSPGGSPKTAVLAAFKVGSIHKKMAVIGDRHYQGLFGGQTDPVPFTVMPLCWERCYGGKKHALNPVGLGVDKSPVEGKAVVRLPNIEDPTELISGKKQRPKPNGAFPIPRMWKQRVKLAGTYDKRWQRTRWPWFPEDFQLSYFNAAPEDQRINGFFKGDEKITLIGLHRDFGKVECRLPGLRARVFLREGSTGSFRDMLPELDTIAIDTDAGKICCVWRAVLEVPSESLDEYSHLYVTHEPLDEKLPLEAYKQRFEDLQEQEREEEEEHEPEEPPTDEEIAAGSFPPVITPAPPEAKRPSSASNSGAYEEGSRTCLPFEPSDVVPFPDPVPLDSPVLIPEMSEEEWEVLHAADYEVEDDDKRTVLDSGWVMPIAQVLEFRDFEFAPEEEPPPEPPPQENVYAEGSTFAFLDKFSLELAQAEVSPSVDLDDVEEPYEETTAFELAHLDGGVAGSDDPATALPALEADADDVDGTAMMQQGEMLAAISHDSTGEEVDADDVDGTAMMSQGEMLAALSRDSGPPSAPERLEEPMTLPALPSDSSGPPRADAPLPTAKSAEPQLIRRAKLEEDAVEPPSLLALQSALADAGVSDAQSALNAPAWAGGKRKADEGEEEIGAAGESDATKEAEEAEKGRALWERRERVLEAVAAGESCADWDLQGVDLSGCELIGADFSGAMLMDVNLSDARLEEVVFEQSQLNRANLERATLVGAKLDDAVLQDANLEGAQLDRVSLVQTVASNANFAGASFMACNCENLELGDGDLTKAKVVKTRLDGADLTGAKLDDATFVDSSLVETDLGGVSALRVTMDGCELTNLRAYEGGDFTDASFVRAKLDGGRFGDSTLRGANFSFAMMDATDFSRAQMSKATLLGCSLKESRFDEAILIQAAFGKSDLFQARFEKAKLMQSDLRGCNLYCAEFLGADTRGAQLELANLKGTKLA